jgi:RNA-directed DNA polymerase
MMRKRPKSRSYSSQSFHSSDEVPETGWSEGKQEGGCMTPARSETKPAPVPERAKQAGEFLARWSRVEPRVWTERMLSALETGVKGGKWYSLIDKVCAPENLQAAFGKTKANRGTAGVDHVTIAMYEQRLEENLESLGNGLREGTYRPSAIRRTMIPKPGKRELRPLGIPIVKDRVARGALRNVMEPIFERDFAEHSYGFRPGRGCKDALRRVDALLRAGFIYVVDADLKNYFDTIPHDKPRAAQLGNSPKSSLAIRETVNH